MHEQTNTKSCSNNQHKQDSFDLENVNNTKINIHYQPVYHHYALKPDNQANKNK